jgi:hypothetical protein
VTVKKYRNRRALKANADKALKVHKIKKHFYGRDIVIPKFKIMRWIEKSEEVTVGALLNFITSRGEVRSFPAVRERLEDAMKMDSISRDLDRAVSFDADSLPPASAETEAYIADMMNRADARRASLGAAALLNPKDHVVNGNVVLSANRGKTVRISSQHRKTIAVKSF